MPNLEQLIDKKRVLLVCGPGGVGKTTVSATIALFAVKRKGRVLVLTIDPARRLANAMGLSELGDEPTLLNPHLKRAGVEVKGELWGMMLDVKRTFDGLIERIAPDAESRDRILNNKYYQTISNALAGSHEYMASEKLYDIFHENEFDLIVMDTPPSRNALDFLDAPKRLFDFLEGRVIHWFIRPYALVGKFSLKLVNRSASFAFKIMERFTGVEVLQDLAEFFVSFEGMYDGFKKRAKEVYELFKSDECAFVVVSSTRSESLTEAQFFMQRLLESRMPVGGVIFNRVFDPIDPSGKLLDRAQKMKQDGVESYVGPQYVAQARSLLDGLIFWEETALLDHESKEAFSKQFKRADIYEIPALPEDIHDIDGLARMGSYLFAKRINSERNAE